MGRQKMCVRPPYFYWMPKNTLQFSPDAINGSPITRSSDSSGPYSGNLPYYTVVPSSAIG